MYVLFMKIAIIGGGAAGLMATAILAEQSNSQNQIFLIEKTANLGAKIVLSGGGRCNLTTALEDIPSILDNYPRGDKFLNSAMRQFPPIEVRQWFETHAVPLKIELDARVFPKSNRGEDIVDLFKKIIGVNNISILLNHPVKKLEKRNKRFIIHFQNEELLIADKVILACGGQAYQSTGSSGDGYQLAKALGHTISPLAPSLGGFILKEKWLKTLAGVTLQKVQAKIQIPITGKKYERRGDLIFTHQGVSGPLLFSLSSLTAFESCTTENPLHLNLDLIPELSFPELEHALREIFQKSPQKLLFYSLTNFIPKSVVETLGIHLNIPIQRRNAEISKIDLVKIIQNFKRLSLTIIGRINGQEMVTAGGVILDEVNPKTMESKICPGLYFAGEILNIDGFTGGFNLQAAWCTGRLAALNSLI
ncbi:MAG: hypothetical protein UT36_C0008G0033 [Candidatus Peregrinibacteria bacterium GW2011_GWF2_39_17]|nr:MAG: hypothetical protein UT36_C0008G0033 [Candidatus Peregrinibacteria bacterium GW2011_GWF2_39_17]